MPEATAFGVASYALTDSKSALCCFDTIIHGTSGSYMRERLADGNLNTTTAEVEEVGTTVGSARGDLKWWTGREGGTFIVGEGW